MVTYRRLAIVVVVALVVIAALPNPTGLRVAAVGAVALLAAGYAMWLANRGEWTRHERPAAAPDARVAEIISARVGEPTHAAAPFVLRTQHAPHERWHGEEPLWMAISDTWLWLLHRTLDGGVGGVKSRFSRVDCTPDGTTTVCNPITSESSPGRLTCGLSPASCTARGRNGCG